MYKNQNKNGQKDAAQDTTKKVILDKEMYKNDPKKAGEEEGEEEERHKHGKGAECGCKSF